MSLWVLSIADVFQLSGIFVSSELQIYVRAKKEGENKATSCSFKINKTDEIGFPLSC